MPRYFFHMFNGSDSVDHEGTELADAAEARKQAIAAAGAIFSEEGGALANGGTLTMKINDENEFVVCTIRFSIQD